MSVHIENLRESNEFLNTLLDHMSSAVLIVDQEGRIHHVNNVFLSMFDKEPTEVGERRCGEVMGCFHSVEEKKACGDTSHCAECPLRRSIIAAFIEKVPVVKARLTRKFIFRDGPEMKHLEFSTRHINFHGELMIVVIIYDITELENQRAALAERKRLLETDLRSAAVIQQSLLPATAPFLRGARFAYRFKPCDSVGGDIFHIFPLPGDRVGMYVLDVSGHGTPAAMVAVCVHQRMHPLSGLVADPSESPPRVLSPEEVLDALDKEFPFERFETFFTICYAVLDLADGCITCSNAAHPPPVIIGPGGDVSVLERSGGIIGLDRISAFGQNDTVLSPGSRLVMVTDGILEHGPDASESFGFQRYVASLQKAARLSLDEQLGAVMGDVEAFAGGLPGRDDMTLFGLEYNSTSGPANGGSPF